jgi:hypothetical protein
MFTVNLEARGGAVGWGPELQVGRSRVRFPMVPLEFFIGVQPLIEMSTRNISWGVLAAGAWGWQPNHFYVLKSGSLKLLESCNEIVFIHIELLHVSANNVADKV